MAKIKEWLKSRKLKSEERYDEEKREFEMAMGEPVIYIKIVMPKGFEDLRTKFLNLERDQQFLEEIEDLVKKRLVYERRGIKSPS